MHEKKSLPSSKKDQLFEQLFLFIDERYSSDEEIKPLGQWAESTPIMLDGRPFSFEKHEYLAFGKIRSLF